MAAISSIVLATAAVAGVGASAYGNYKASKAAKAQAQASAAITQKELEAEAVRKKAAELDARRRSVEVIRNQQRARSISLTNATGQNAQLGTGLLGGYGQISGQTGFDLLGVNQNLELGQNLFDINSAISQQKIAYSRAGSSLATGSAISSFGGTLLNSLPAIKGLAGGFGSPYTGTKGPSSYVYAPASPFSSGYYKGSPY